MSVSVTAALQSTSQFGEDIELLQFFGLGYRGTFVEVGANDGVQGSNTYLLETHGWRGVLVEPNARLAAALRVSRPLSVVVAKAAVSDPNLREVDFYEYSGFLSTGESYDGLSRVGERSLLDAQVTAAGAAMHWTRVPAATLDQILEEADYSRPVDFVSIDVEGLELSVLQGFSLARYRPRVMLIEDNSCGTDTRIPNYLTRRDYRRVHRTGVNDWYVRKEEAYRFTGRRIRLTFERVVSRCQRVLFR